MSLNRENYSPDSLELGGGRLTSHPGRDLYFYTFQLPGGQSFPIGRRGDFIWGQKVYPARVADLNGPHLSLCITAPQNPGKTIEGQFHPKPLPKIITPDLTPKGGPTLPGLELFFDPTDGWVMQATEAAGDKCPKFSPKFWPLTPREELPSRLSTVGPTFLWSQKPDPDSTTALSLIHHFLNQNWRCLVLADNPRLLETLAQLPQAIFLAPTPDHSPLEFKCIYTLVKKATLQIEKEIDGKREELRLNQQRIVSCKAAMEQWHDLNTLESRFVDLGREVAALRAGWDQVYQQAESSHILWEEAQIKLEKSCRGFLGFGQKSPGHQQVSLEKSRRLELEETERALKTVKAEEKKCLEEARRLESRLYQTRLEAKNWRSLEELKPEMDKLKGQQETLAGTIASFLTRPQPQLQDFIHSRLILSLLGDVPEEGLNLLSGQEFETIIILSSTPPDHQGRQYLATLARWATKHLVVLGDFTFWPIWGGGTIPRISEGNQEAWANLLVAEEADASKTFMATDGLFNPHHEYDIPGPALARLELAPLTLDSKPRTPKYRSIMASVDDGKPKIETLPLTLDLPQFLDEPVGLGLRALGELGPANPASALITAQAALNFALQGKREGPAVIIITPSEAQSQLIQLVLQDLKAPPGLIFTGLPQHFHHWPQVPLVILETAFEAPHRGHPWAWPAYGRSRLAWAWRLAAEQLWLAGRQGWMSQLPAQSPLASLWNKAKTVIIPTTSTGKTPSFWDTLDRAKNEIWAILPTFAPFWWRPLESHFLAAANRRVKVKLMVTTPLTEEARKYTGQVIQTLTTSGCHVNLATGFPGFMAVVDGTHFTWGNLTDSPPGINIWTGINSAILPATGPELAQLLQLELIIKHLGRRGGGLKTCPQCGWAQVLINSPTYRGFSDDQPLKIGCLGQCQSRRDIRDLGRRDVFLIPPKCSQDFRTQYRQVQTTRHKYWVCPLHPEGSKCPSYRVLPGDPPDPDDKY